MTIRMAVLLHSSFHRLLIRSEMCACGAATIRKGGREASSLVSRRECLLLVWERTEIWQGLIKDIGFLPELERSCIARDTRGLFN